jgi:hypothetical protein
LERALDRYRETRAPEDAGQLFERGYELVHGHKPGALDRPGQINIDARHAQIHEAPKGKQKLATCGNCGSRYEITDDPLENHHRAMRHKLDCGKGELVLGPWSEDERQRHISDFQNQPMQRLFRDRAMSELEAGADPARLQLTGVDIFAPAPQSPEAREIAAAELGAQAAEAIRQWQPKPRPRWWQFWKWFR